MKDGGKWVAVVSQAHKENEKGEVADLPDPQRGQMGHVYMQTRQLGNKYSTGRNELERKVEETNRV